MGQAVQILQDPGYQAAATSGAPGAAEAYIRQKYGYFSGDPTQIINTTLNNEMLGKNLGTVLGSGVSRLDQQTQKSIVDGSLDANKIDPKTRLQMAQMLATGYQDTANQQNRAAQWDQLGLGAATQNNATLRDGTAVPSGVSRAAFINGLNSKNPLAQPQAQPQPPAIPSFAPSTVQAEMKRRGLLK
jgi:hypothetical protein